jgi:hypothetical protein
MSPLDDLAATEARLETLASSGNTYAGAIASHILTVIAAVKDVAAGAPAADLSPLSARIDALAAGVVSIGGAVDKLNGRVAMIENAFSILSASAPETPAPAVPPTVATDPAPGVQPTL